MNIILIRYGELYLKGNNRHFFERCLINNINNNLKGLSYRLVKSSGRFFIEEFMEEDANYIINTLRKIFGIHSISPAYCVESDLNCICNKALELAPRKGTFKVVVNRADKSFSLNSMQVAAKTGAYLLQNIPELKVDIFNPQNEIFIDIREKNKTYIMVEKLSGSGGMPVGSAGKGLLMLSGGIDSPVAGYMMAKRGMSVNAIHFHSYPYTSEKAKNKVLELARIVSEYTGPMNVNIISLTEIQQEIHMKCPKEYMITLVRRFMLRIANILAEDINCKVLVTGESLGQVASQTIESIDVISSVSSRQILRPLIGMDKSEIIAIAEKIGTFNTSIEPYEDCCTVFLPKNPVIKPKKDLIEKAEEALNIEALVNRALDTREKITVSFR